MNDFNEYGSSAVKSAKGSWNRLHPGIRSALALGVVLLGLNILQTLSAGTSLIVCLPIQVMLFGVNGGLAAYFALQSGYHTSDLPRVGVVAGFFGWILPSIFYLIFGVILGLVTFGIGFLGIAAWILCFPISLMTQIILGAGGAWLYGRFAPTSLPEEY